MLAPVGDSTGKCLNRTKVGVATAGESNDFITNSILLGGEGKGAKARLLYFTDGSGQETQSSLTNEELYSSILNGVVSEGESVYSPGRRRKKNAMMIMSTVAW